MFEDDGATGPSEQSRDLAPVPAADPGARTSSLSALLVELDRVVDAITTLDPDGLDGPAAAEASLRVHRAGDRLRAMQLGWLAAAEDARVWLGTGARSFRTWVARTHDVSFAEAGRWVRPARVWREVTPMTALAARLGRTSTAKAALIAATATTPHRAPTVHLALAHAGRPLSASHDRDRAPQARTTGRSSLRSRGVGLFRAVTPRQAPARGDSPRGAPREVAPREADRERSPWSSATARRPLLEVTSRGDDSRALRPRARAAARGTRTRAPPCAPPACCPPRRRDRPRRSRSR